MQHIDMTGSQYSNYIQSPKSSFVTQAVCLSITTRERSALLNNNNKKGAVLLKRCVHLPAKV